MSKYVLYFIGIAMGFILEGILNVPLRPWHSTDIYHGDVVVQRDPDKFHSDCSHARVLAITEPVLLCIKPTLRQGVSLIFFEIERQR